MIYQPESENSISFTSEYLVYNPKLKYTMNFPGVSFCGDNGGIMLLVGSFPAVSNLYYTLYHSFNVNKEKEKAFGDHLCYRWDR